jgi:hypothetical protein
MIGGHGMARQKGIITCFTNEEKMAIREYSFTSEIISGNHLKD